MTAASLTLADPAVESAALNATRFLPADGIFLAAQPDTPPAAGCRIVFDQAGFAIYVTSRPDANGELHATMWAALPAVADDDTTARRVSDHKVKSLFGYCFAEKHLEDVLTELVRIAQQLSRLRAGGWHVEPPRSCSNERGFDIYDWQWYLRLFSPLDVSVSRYVVLDPRNRWGSPLPVRKVLRQLRATVSDLAAIADMPVRYDDSAVQGRLDAFMAAIPEGPGLASLALARWPQLEGPFLAAVIERAADLEQGGMSAVQAVERAGQLPLAAAPISPERPQDAALPVLTAPAPTV